MSTTLYHTYMCDRIGGGFCWLRDFSAIAKLNTLDIVLTRVCISYSHTTVQVQYLSYHPSPSEVKPRTRVKTKILYSYCSINVHMYVIFN